MTILVTGATGRVGRYLVDELLRDGQEVRALTRTPARATDLPPDVSVAQGDLTDPGSLSAALEGVTGLHLLTISGADQAPLRTGPEIVEAARQAGVRRVTVLWSGQPSGVEEAVEASDLQWAILQPVEFMSNTLAWTESIRSEGVAREAFADELSAVIHEVDIARVARAALTTDGHAGQHYSLTGPEALTVRERALAVGGALGRDIEFVELTERQFRDRARAEGVEEEVIDFVVSWHQNPPPASYTVNDTVRQITGHPPATFAQWAAEHVGSFQR